MVYFLPISIELEFCVLLDCNDDYYAVHPMFVYVFMVCDGKFELTKIVDGTFQWTKN